MQAHMILVTGATGYIGSRLVERLRLGGQQVRILVRQRAKALQCFGSDLADVQVAVGDLGDPHSLKSVLQNVDQVYHCASLVSFHGDPGHFDQVNRQGTTNLLDVCAGAGVNRVVHLSSVAAGGPGIADGHGGWRPRTEEDPPAPLSGPYGRSKLAQERTALAYNERGLEVVVVRPSAVFGPGDPNGVNLLLRLIKRKRLPFYLGSRRTPVNVVYVDDVVRGSIAAMERGQPGQVYNLVGPNVTHKSLFAMLARVSGGRSPHWEMPTAVLESLSWTVARTFGLVGARPPIHPDDVRNWTAPWLISGEKANRELGLVPVDLEGAWRVTDRWLTEM